MNSLLKSAIAVSAAFFATHAAAQVTFYEHEGFRGRAFTADKPIGNLERYGFNDRAGSVIVDHGRWEVCEDAGFHGRCVVLRRGNYDTLRSLGMSHRISSIRPVGERARHVEEVPPPVAAVPVYEYRQRPNERVFEAPVTSVHAVVGPPERRCWVERQEVAEPPRGEPNVGGAIVGGIIGGVLGHQIGSGRGNDVATAGGAVAGAAIGANVGRQPGGTYSRDVQRCEGHASGRPEYWDVTYDFRGTPHHVQMSAPPGATILVNGNGEPRQ